MVNGFDSSTSKSWSLVLIPYRCFFQFTRGLGVYFYLWHQVRCILACALANTSSASSKVAVPLLISLILRQISLSHATATSASAGPSRLATTSLANCARSTSVSSSAAVRKLSSSAVFKSVLPSVFNPQMWHQYSIRKKAKHLGPGKLGPDLLSGASRLHFGPSWQRYEYSI